MLNKSHQGNARGNSVATYEDHSRTFGTQSKGSSTLAAAGERSSTIGRNQKKSTNSKPYSTDDTGPFVGLQNKLKYICFLNSVCQCLIATPGLVEALGGKGSGVVKIKLNGKSHYKGKIANKFIELISHYNQAQLNGEKRSSRTKQNPASHLVRLDKAINEFQQVFGDAFS
jgi:ubiquitin C-terminal hydrolase